MCVCVVTVVCVSVELGWLVWSFERFECGHQNIELRDIIKHKQMSSNINQGNSTVKKRLFMK